MESDIQQPAGFLCKKLKPGQHRLEAPRSEWGIGELEYWSVVAALPRLFHYSKTPPLHRPISFARVVQPADVCTRPPTTSRASPVQVRLQFAKRKSCSGQPTRNDWEAHPAASTNFGLQALK